MGEKDAVEVNPSGATICWYHRLEERYDFKSTENWGRGNNNGKCTIYMGYYQCYNFTVIYIVIFESFHN